MRDLAQVANVEEFNKAMKYYYPKQRRDWYMAMEGVLTRDLKSIAKKKQKDPKEQIEICVAGERELLPLATKENEWEGRDESYNCGTNKYSLSFRPWKDTANIRVSEESLRCYKIEELLAHYIWEITWYGPEEKMMEHGKELMKRAKEIKKDIKKHPENIRPISELFEDKNKKDDYHTSKKTCESD